MADLFRVIFGRVLGRSVLNPIVGSLVALLRTEELRITDAVSEVSTGQLFEDGDRMLFEDGDVMLFEGV
jgi:hypothetical protein